MLGPDLPDLDERLRRLPAAGVIVALLAGALATRAAVLDRTPGIVLQPGAAQEMSATRLAHGHARQVPANKEILAVQSSDAILPEPPRFAGRYDPDHDRWTAIRPPPQPALTQQALAWTGAALVVDGTRAYDPAGNRWLRLPLLMRWHWVGQGRLVGYPRSGVIATLEPATR